MKKLTLLIICSWFSMLYTYSQDVIYKPEGALIQSLRNDDESEILIPGCYHGLKMDNINNLYGNYWSFYLVGTVDNISNITVKPYCSARKIALEKGCGYVANYNDGRGDVYVRIYVTKMVTSTSGEIIGATLLYQTNYQSKEEMERAAQARAEREASKIFWNGDAVPDASLRKILLGKFDTDKDGKISQVEAAKKNSLEIQGGTRMAFSETGIANLTGLTALTLKNTSIKGNIVLGLPNLHSFSLADNQNRLDKLDLTGCTNIDSIWIGSTNIIEVNLRNCKKLKYLDFYSKYYSTIDEQLDISGCTALEGINNEYCVRGKVLNASGCTALIYFDTIEFNEINLAGCISLSGLSWEKDDRNEYTLSRINLDGCHKLEIISLRNSKLTELKLSDCKKLGSLRLGSTAIKSLDLSNMKHLSDLSCYGGDLRTLNVSGCDSLRIIWCNNNKLESINLTNCHNLKELYCHKNKLMSLDVSDCDSLQIIHCYRNPSLAFLDVTHNSKLEGIQCSNTAIQELDISRSETTEWASNEPGDPIRVPGATQGFKTLWINEKQKIEVYTHEGSEFKPMFKPMKDKDFDKSNLLSANWDEIRQEYIKRSPEEWKADLDFKIKVRK